jgi:hypothetical protein
MFITDEEKNKIALSSAMALPNDPSRAGMKPDQIKKVLFGPTKKLIEYLNLKLSVLGDLTRLISGIEEQPLENDRKAIVIKYFDGTSTKIVVHDDKIDLVTKETFDNTVITFKESVNNINSELTALEADLPNTYMKLSDREKLIVDVVEIVTNMESSGEVVVYGIKTDLNREDYTLTVSLTTSGGTVISTGTVDFPLESVVVGGDEQDGIVTLTLQNGNTISFDIGDLVYGLVSQTKHDEDIAEVKALINTKIASAITTTLNTEV